MSAKRRISMTTEGKVKMLLSCLLLVSSLVVSIKARNPYVFFGMLFSSFGDFFIAASRGAIYKEKVKEMFNSGVAAFAIAHFAYAYSMFDNSKAKLVQIVFCIVAVFSFCAFLLGLLNKKSATILYAICLIATCVIAFKFSTISGIGYSFFILSDLILALFEEKSPKWQYAIWASYVPAQALILTGFLIS